MIAGLGVSAGLEPRLGPLSAAYVLFLAVLGPILARIIEPLLTTLTRKKTLLTKHTDEKGPKF